jgi:hypothetical protein
MLKLTRFVRHWKTERSPGIPVAKKVGKIKIRMNRIIKGQFNDFIAPRPDVGTKEWLHLQYSDQHVSRPQLEGYMGAKDGNTWDDLEFANDFMKLAKGKKVLNLGLDTSGAKTIFLAKHVLGFDQVKMNCRMDDKGASLTCVAPFAYPDEKTFAAIHHTGNFTQIKLPYSSKKATIQNDLEITEHIRSELLELNQRYDFVVLDLDHEYSKQAGGAHNFARNLIQNFRTALYLIEKDGTILIKMHGVPEAGEKFMQMLKLYFHDVKHLEFRREHLKHRQNKHNTYVICKGFCKNRMLPEPVKKEVQVRSR